MCDQKFESDNRKRCESKCFWPILVYQWNNTFSIDWLHEYILKMNVKRNMKKEGFFHSFIRSIRLSKQSEIAGVFIFDCSCIDHIERNIISRSTNKCQITHMHKELSHSMYLDLYKIRAYTVHMNFTFEYLIVIFQNYCLLRNQNDPLVKINQLAHCDWLVSTFFAATFSVRKTKCETHS